MTNGTYKGYQLTASPAADGKWQGSAVIPGNVDSLMSVEGAVSEAAVIGRLRRWIDKKVYTPGKVGMWNKNDGTEFRERKQR